MKRIVTFIVFILLIVLVGNAEEIYIAQSSAGLNDGSSASNAKSVSWLNTSNNWGNDVGKVGPGDRIHLCGIITTAITIHGSGFDGFPIIILFESDAKMSAETWPIPNWWGGGAITLSDKSYIIIDGGTNGIIECTANGTDLENQINSVAVGASSCSFLTVQNLLISNMYVRIGTTEKNGYGAGIVNECTLPPYTISGFTVSNCIITEAYVGISADYGSGCSNYTFIGNTISRVNWGGRIGDRNGSSTMTNLIVSGNIIHTFTNWNETVDNSYHHNGFYGWAESGGRLDGVKVYGNKIGPNYGGQYATGGIFFSGNVSDIKIYNNVFIANNSDNPADGFITVGANTGYGGFTIVNNTFNCGGIGNAIAAGSGNGIYNIVNNIINSVTTGILFNYSGSSILYASNNLYYGLNESQSFSKSSTGTSSFYTFSNWQNLGYDQNSLVIDPLLIDEYKLLSNSPAKNSGVDLSSIFTTDFDGNTRTEPWSIGAYEQNSSITYGSLINSSSVILKTLTIQ